MLLAQISIVDQLCKRAENDGAITPKNPSAISAELNARINR